MNVPLVIAGSLGILGTAIHGGVGEVLVVRKLSPASLPPTSFGGPKMTRLMIHVTWHITTIAFLTMGTAFLLSGTFLDGDTAHVLALVAACASTGFAVLALGLGAAYTRSLRTLVRHPGPVLMTTVAVLAWVGVL